MLNEFEAKITEVEEEVFQLDIITSFESRGWALYECLNGETTFDSTYDIKEIVVLGRAKNKINYDVPYILLPLSKNDADWMSVRSLIFELRDKGRGPYYVEVEEGYEDNEKWIKPVGAFLIDSIIVSPPFINLVIDSRLSNVSDGFQLKGNTIELHLAELNKIRKQLMLALR